MRDPAPAPAISSAGSDGVARDARADVALDQPYRPFPLADGSGYTDRLVSNECDSSVADFWLEEGWRYTYSQCSAVREEATGRWGVLLRLQPAATP